MKRITLEFENGLVAYEVAEAIRQLSRAPSPGGPQPIPAALVQVFAGRTTVRLVEPLEVDLIPFGKVDPTLCNALQRKGWASVKALEDLEDDYGEEPWQMLLDMPNVGPRRVLNLVNWLRENGVELSWMSSWDEASANWRALEGIRRAEPHRG